MTERSRKLRILRKAEPVSETASIIADALEDVAGSICCLASTRFEGMTPGERRQIAAVMFQTAKLRFGGVKYDGQKISQMEIEQLDQLWVKLTGGRLRR